MQDNQKVEAVFLLCVYIILPAFGMVLAHGIASF